MAMLSYPYQRGVYFMLYTSIKIGMFNCCEKCKLKEKKNNNEKVKVP